MEEQLDRVPVDLLQHAIAYIESIRNTNEVQEAFSIACDTIHEVVPDCCISLWMWDEEKRCLCRARLHSSAMSDLHIDHEEIHSEDSVLGRIVLKAGLDADAQWISVDELEHDWCSGSKGLAYMRINTVDGLKLLLVACVPTSQNGDFTFYREFFILVAEIFVQAIERIRQVNERALLSAITQLQLTATSGRQFFDKVAHTIKDAFTAAGCSIFLYDNQADVLRLGGTTGLFDTSSGEKLSEEQLISLEYRRKDGLTGWMLTTLNSVRMFDAKDPDEWSEICQVTNTNSPFCKSAETPNVPCKKVKRPLLAVPIFTNKEEKKEFIGVIRIHGKKTTPYFLPSDQMRLEAVSDELARAVAVCQSTLETHRELREQSDAFDAVLAIDRSVEFRSALEIIAKLAKNLLRGSAASVLLREPNKEQLKVVADVSNHSEKFMTDITLNFKQGICGWSAHLKEPIAVADVSKDKRFYNLSNLGENLLSDVKSEMCAPIMIDDELLGVINVDSDAVGWFSEDFPPKILLLESLARRIAILITREQFYQQVPNGANSVSAMLNISKSIPTQVLVHHFKDQVGALFGVISRLPKDPEQSPYGEDIKKLNEIAGKVSTYWKGFAKVPAFDQPNHQLLYINEVLDEADWLFESLAKLKNIKFKRKFDNQLSKDSKNQSSRVELDELHFRVIVSFLISNAVNASEDGGVIQLVTEAVNDMAEVRVIDCGEGISEEDQEVIRESKFTTQSNGRDTGLSHVFQCVQVLGGEIDFLSKVGQGTTFTIRFPLVKTD